MYESAEPTNFAERVMGTNRDALLAVIEHLKNEARAGERQTLSLFRNEEAGKRQLLIPVYRETCGLMAEERELPGFEVTGHGESRQYTEYSM